MDVTELMDTFEGADLLGVTPNAFRVAICRAGVQRVGHAAFGQGRPRSLYRRSDVEALAATRRAKEQRAVNASG